MNPQPAIEIVGLTRFYGSTKALAGISLTIPQGEIFGLLGPNGGGKTTLFRILSTLMPPSSGTAAVFGLDVASQPRQVRGRMGVVFQSPNLDPKLTVAENLWHQGHLYGLRGGALQERIQDGLFRIGMEDRRNALVETLSGGQRRRVEIAKGLLHRPGLLLLDEPSTGLDPGVRGRLWDDLTALRRQEGVTVVLTTHLLEEAEKCDRIAILNRGELVAEGTPDSLKQEIGGEVVLIEARDPEALAAQIRAKFAVDAIVFGGKLRFEHPRGHELIPRLIETFPGEIRSAAVGKPTLEDVFIRRTGQQFWTDAGDGNGRK